MSRLLPWLRLCRFPAVFTALADIALGWVLTHGPLREGSDVTAFVCLLLASAGLYLSGMVFNDLFDRKQDAAERPNRPIPSGQVSVKSAAIFGSALMIGGLTAAAFAGRASIEAAILLAACILSYDGGMKRTLIGPVLMGSCRFFNVLLGASGGFESIQSILQEPPLWVASGMGICVAGITWFARTEAQASRRYMLTAAMFVINFAYAALLAWILNWPYGGNQTASLFVLLVIALAVNRKLTIALADPQPKSVQLAVKTMILSIITLDATLIYAHSGEAAIAHSAAVLLLIIPSIVLSKRIMVT